MHITIVGDQPDRLEIIRQLLESGDDRSVSVLSAGNKKTSKFKKAIDRADLVLADLAYVSGPAPVFIKEFKRDFPGTRLIGIHFYENRKLIEPLMQAGLDGYMHSNTHKTLMNQAVEDVAAGKTVILNRD
jgi:DNA-binding NarL/FixJ family response regulator